MEMNELVSRFRLASRDVRNRYFHPPDWDENEWDVMEWFEEVERALFESLVLCPAGLDNIDYGTPNPNIVVALTTVGVPIMVNRERGGASGYWDHPVKTIDTSATL